jgi:hypothetical protein
MSAEDVIGGPLTWEEAETLAKMAAERHMKERENFFDYFKAGFEALSKGDSNIIKSLDNLNKNMVKVMGGR